jgi:TPR repeat protein
VQKLPLLARDRKQQQVVPDRCFVSACASNHFAGSRDMSGSAAAPAQPPVVMLADGRLQQRAKLGAVVTDAVRRWYLETEKEALRGDVVSSLLMDAVWHPGIRLPGHTAGRGRWQPAGLPPGSTRASRWRAAHHPAPPSLVCPGTVALQKAQALLGQMLIEGYGCQADPVKGREWAEKARRRGYRMDRVYCVL